MREMSDVRSNRITIIQSTTNEITKKTGGWIEMNEPCHEKCPHNLVGKCTAIRDEILEIAGNRCREIWRQRMNEKKGELK